MLSNRRVDTKPEVALHQRLHARGLRFRKDMPIDLSQRRVGPDLVVTAGNLATVSVMNRSHTARHGWYLFVSPWHLDERIEGFPVPDGAVTFTGSVDLAASEVDSMTRRYRDIADAVARSGRPLVLTGDCLTALGLVAGLQRRHRDL